MKLLQADVHFHWKFWAPKDCVGGPVFFGRWVEIVYRDEDGKVQENEQSWDQFCIKGFMGLYGR